MPYGNHNSIPTFADDLLDEQTCPKCGAPMEPIDTEPDGPPLEHMQLCPECYLVTWIDDAGLQVRQGVPMKKDTTPPTEPAWLMGAPRKC